MKTTLPNLTQSFQLFKIAEKLQSIQHDSLFAKSLRDGAKERPQEAINMVIDQAKDNYEMVERIVGAELLQTICAFKVKATA